MRRILYNNRLCIRRFYSTDKKHDESSAITERFQAILDEKLHTSSKSIFDSDPKLREIYQKHSSETAKNKEFERKYQQQLAVKSNEDILKYNKHARDIADTSVTPVWTGKETLQDSSLRMILDSAPKKMEIKPRKRDLKSRLSEARDNTLDYKLNPKEEKDNFRELYKERLLGPSMLMNSNVATITLGLIGNVADAKIDAHMDRKTGKFKQESMDSVRGKPLDKRHLANSRDTNYFMNQILNKQEVLPPWVENQQNINRQVQSLRDQLKSVWFKQFTKILKPNVNQEEDFLNGLDILDPQTLRDKSFFQTDRPYLEEKVKLINQSIRHYNLSSPSPNFHKFKLLLDNEIEKSFESALSNIKADFSEWYRKQKNTTKKTDSSAGSTRGLLRFFSNSKESSTKQNSSNEGVNDNSHTKWSLFKNMFL